MEMSGEWVEDCYYDSYAEAPLDGSALTDKECSRRVVRGGSWDGQIGNARAAYREYYAAVNRSNRLGFRIARMLER